MWSRLSEQLIKDIAEGKYAGSEVNLCEQKLDQDLIPELVEALNSNKKIKSLNLSKTELSDKSVRLLAKCKHIREMHLDDNEIGNGGAIALASANKLKKLHLSLNLIGDLGAKHLANCSSLTELDISENGLTDLGARYFLYENKLKCLFITGNQEVEESTYAKLRTLYEVHDIVEDINETEVEELSTIYRDSKVKTLFQAAPLPNSTEKTEEKKPSPAR